MLGDQLQSIYLAAAALPSEDVESYLTRACGDDATLREAVERMLSSRASSQSFLASQTTIAATPVPVSSFMHGTMLGRYRLLDRLGEGGFGTVFLAEQREPVVRRVALKMLHEKHTAPDVLARFEAERQALALMEHPHIAKFFDAGSDDSGRPYFVMELVTGRPITTYCDEKKMTIRQRLEVLEQVCHAIQHAHTKGIIHRDLKPGNILVSLRDGRPHATVIDFGIAKATQMRLTARTLFTADHSLMGTPEYMSPEQVTGSPDIDTRTDVYSLGVLLYEQLVGSTPFGTDALREAGFIEIVRSIRESDPPKPSVALKRLRTALVSDESKSSEKDRLSKLAHARSTDVRRFLHAEQSELDVIAMKALEKNPSQRYQTANELAQDIRRYLDGQPILAAPHSAWYWISKMARRHRVLFATVGASFVAITAVAILALVGWMKAHETGKSFQQANTNLELSNMRLDEAREDAEEQREYAEMQKREAFGQRIKAEREAYRANIRVAAVALESGHRMALRDAIRNCDQNLHNWEWEYLHSWTDRSTMVLRSHRAAVNDAIFLGNKDLVVTASEDEVIRIFDPAGGMVLHELNMGSEEDIVALASADDTNKFLVASNNAVQIWDIGDFDKSRIVFDLSNWPGKAASNILSLAWDTDGSVAAVGCDDGTVYVFGISPDAIEPRVLQVFRAGVLSVAFSGDGRQLIATGASGGIRIYDIVSGKREHAIQTRAGYLGISAVLLPNERAVTVDSAGVVQLWDLRDTSIAKGRFDLEEPAYAMAASPDGNLVAVAHADSLSLFDVSPKLRRVSMYRGHDGALASVAFSTDSSRIITASQDTTARIWDTHDSDHRLRFKGSDGQSKGTISNDGSMIALLQGRRVEVHDLATGEFITSVSQPGLLPIAASFTPDGRRLLVYAGSTHQSQWTGDGVVFDVFTGEQVATLQDLLLMPPISRSEPLVNAQGFHEAVFSPAGDRVAVRALGWRAVVYDWQSGDKLFSLTGHTDGVHTVSFSPDGQKILTLSIDGTAKLWDAQTGSLITTLDGQAGPLLGSQFSSNGRFLLTTSSTKIIVWRVSNGSRISEAQVLEPPAEMIELTNDGKMLLVREADAFYTIDTASGRMISRIPVSHPDWPVQLSPDAKRLVSISADRQIQIWDTLQGTQLLTLYGGHDADSKFVGFALGGSAIVSSHGDTTKIWDSRSAIERAELVRAFVEQREAAEARIRADLEEGTSIERIRDDLLIPMSASGLRTRVLMAAFSAVLDDQDSTSEHKGLPESSSSPTALELEIAIAEAERSGNSPSSLTRLGVAFYYDGQYQRALLALRRSEQQIAHTHTNTDQTQAFHRPENGGYIAMSLGRLGRSEEAHAAIESLRTLFVDGHHRCDCNRYLDAAIEVIYGNTSIPESVRGTEEVD